jgi:cytoskeletal protein CcmA (bactofilin family)
VEIVGSIKCSGNIHLAGKLNGDLTCSGNAVLLESASVKGNLSVESVSVMGQVSGNITARDRIELKSTARVAGDIKSKRLTVEDGVTFVGKSEVNPSAGAGRPAAESRSVVAEAVTSEAEEPSRREESDRGKAGLFGRRT